MKRVLRGILQLAVLVVPALAVYAWQSRDLLPATARHDAPDFELPQLGGTTLGPDALEGRPAVLYFFAPWCGVCAASAPQLRWFDRLAGDSARVVLVALDYGDAAEVEDYARKHSLTMPVLLGDPAVAAAYRIRGYPTYYVLDAAGRVAARDFGFSTVAGLWWRTLGPGR
jgi:thiol-disulfide isomerase/thioredoxin